MIPLALAGWVTTADAPWTSPPAPAASAKETRVGVFVGDDHGPEGLPVLAFADSDARKMHDLFVDYGGISAGDAQLLQDQSAGHVEDAFGVATRAIAAAKARGERTLVVFYYSGHGDENGLMLGGSRIADADLRSWLEATGADVRIAILDSCRSGAVVRAKGGIRGPSYNFAVDVKQVNGTAILTSSAANEFSQESDEIGGGFFTHFLHTALAGAADSDHDGRVTLTEAYAYVHGQTAFATKDAPGTQTPSFDYDLSGAGDVVLTKLDTSDAAIEFPGGLDGTYAIWDEDKKRYEAEVDGATATRIAVPHGSFDVQHRMPGWVDEAKYTLRTGDVATVKPSDFSQVSYEDTAARGYLEKEARRATIPPLSVYADLGGRGFAPNSVYATQYVPGHPAFGLEVRQRFQNGLFVSVDFLDGEGSGALDFGTLGQRDVNVSSRSLGFDLGYSPFHLKVPWLITSMAARAEWVGFFRSFSDGEVPKQGSMALAPGASFALGFRYKRVSFEWVVNPMLLPVKWDDHRVSIYAEVLPLRFGIAL